MFWNMTTFNSLLGVWKYFKTFMPRGEKKMEDIFRRSLLGR